MALKPDQIERAVISNTHWSAGGYVENVDCEAVAREVNDLFMQQLEEASRLANTILDSGIGIGEEQRELFPPNVEES